MDYKKKYLKLKYQLGGMATKILLDGTSSSGKSTISKFYEMNGYKHVNYDDYTNKAYTETYSSLQNEYIKQDIKDNEIKKRVAELMIESGKDHNLIIFDDSNRKVLEYYNRNDIFLIVVYTSFNDLVRNINSRRSTEPRGAFIFKHYPRRYIKTNNKEKSLDTINRQKFIKLLKENMKYEFESEKDLINFAKNIFQKMGIDDDNDHYIKLRDELTYDFIMNTKNKTKDDIFDELKKITDEYISI
jgi:hypothetical protein